MKTVAALPSLASISGFAAPPKYVAAVVVFSGVPSGKQTFSFARVFIARKKTGFLIKNRFFGLKNDIFIVAVLF